MDILFVLGFIFVFFRMVKQGDAIEKMRRQIQDLTDVMMRDRAAGSSVRASAAPQKDTSIRVPDSSFVDRAAPAKAQRATVIADFVQDDRPKSPSSEPVPPAPYYDSGPLKQPAVSATAYQDDASSEATEAFVAWLKEDWLLKLGGLLVLIAFGWFVSYAIMQGWITETGRITLGIFVGVAVLIFGFKRMFVFASQGAVFMVVGSTIILLTIYAARSLYGMFTPSVALTLMFMSVVFIAFASVQFNRRSMAFVSLVMAAVAPLLTHSETVDFVGLFAYLFVVILGAIWVSAITGWRELTLAGLILVFMYSSPYLGGEVTTDRSVILLFMYAFVALFFLNNIGGMLWAKRDDLTVDTVTALLNALFMLLWVMVAVPSEWQSLNLVAWMLAFSLASFVVYKAVDKPEPFYVYASVSLILLGIATALEFDGHTLIYAYIFEAIVLSLIAMFVMHRPMLARGAAGLLAIPGLLSIESVVADSWRISVFNQDFFVLLVMGVTLLWLGVLYAALEMWSDNQEGAVAHSVMVVCGSVYGYILIWLSLHAALLAPSEASVHVLVWAFAIAVWLMLFGLTSYVYMQMIRLRSSFDVGAAIAVLFLGMMTIIELDGPVRVMVLAGECYMISLVAYVLLRNIQIAQYLSVLFAVPILLSLPSITSSAWGSFMLSPIFHPDSYVLIVMMTCLMSLGAFYAVSTSRARDSVSDYFNGALLTIGSLYLYVWLWLILHAYFREPAMAVMFCLFEYTAVGIVAYFYGLKKQSFGIQIYGGLLLGGVVLRLLLVDVWEMAIELRIVTFFIIGAVLMATAFLRRR